MSEETWRPIPGWELLYEASDAGRVRSLPHTREGRPGVTMTFPGRVLAGWSNKDGYRLVALNRGPRKTTVGIHRLVLLAFVGTPPEGHEGCHGDGDPSNNSLSNLRWDDRSGNTYDRIEHGTHHSARKMQCPRGHAYDDKNTYKKPNGARACRTCRRDDATRRYQTKKEQMA